MACLGRGVRGGVSIFYHACLVTHRRMSTEFVCVLDVSAEVRYERTVQSVVKKKTAATVGLPKMTPDNTFV